MFWSTKARAGQVIALMAVLATPIIGCSDDSPTSPTPSPTPTPTLEEQLQAILDESVGSEIPGAVLRVSGPGLDFHGTAGEAEVTQGVACRPDHVFHVASVGKSFMGLAVAQLVAEATLDLDAPIGTWLDADVVSRIPSSEMITLRDLMQHTSGIFDPLNESYELPFAIVTDPTHVWTNAELITYAFDQPLHFEPGSAHRYANANYWLAALIVESVTGQAVSDVLRERVFDPLGMQATTTSNHEPLAGVPAHGYVRDDGALEDATIIALRWEAGSGGQWSTADDLTRFLHGLFETDEVADDALRALILTPSPHAPYGLGLSLIETPDGPAIFHGGAVYGYFTMPMYFPEAETSIVLCVNSQIADEEGALFGERLFARIAETVFGR